MKRKLLSMVLVTAMAITALSGCAGSKDKETQASSTESIVETTKDTEKESVKETEKTSDNKTSSEGVITIKHSKGETEIALNPKKVAIYDLGILDTVQTLNIEAEFAVPMGNLPDYLNSYEDAVNIGSVKEPDLEALFAFEPDVIFMSGRLSEYYDQLSEIAPTVYVDLNAETYMEDFKENTTEIAALFDKTEEADKLLASIETNIEKVKTEAESSDKKALILLTNDGSISAYGIGSRFGLIHNVLGVKAADETIEVSTHGQETNFEYIAEVNPDIIFVVDRTAVVGGETDAVKALDNDLVNETTAAKDGKVVYLNADYWYLTGGGLTSVDGMVKEVEAAIQ
jgi:iron complex transport system substrate-binding protein